ncbi:hypothetical protein F4680DRAFT_419102 [Xylaria scruposa]|nr:hypothetical protein F4680DRAFT_419102 [Xylaria scruposa]
MQDSDILARYPLLDDEVANEIAARPYSTSAQIDSCVHSGSQIEHLRDSYSVDSSRFAASTDTPGATMTTRYQAQVPGLVGVNQAYPILWTSIWLHKVTLLLFSALFTGLWVALILLWYYNTQMNGFELNISSNPYTWTYGPTVVLTILVGLWRQVDYHCKILQPWKAMRMGPAVSTKSVLLDYISPLQILSFWRALKNRHWAVVLTVAGFTLLKAIIVASTTFLVTLPTSLSGSFPIAINTKFDGSDFLQSLGGMVDRPPGLIDDGDQRIRAYWNISSALVYAVNGTLSGQYQPAPQILNGTVIQTFDVAEAKTNITMVTGLVEAFIPNITCETASASWSSPGKSPAGYQISGSHVELTSETCSVGKEPRPIGLSCSNTTNPCQTYYMLRVNCSSDDSPRSDNPTFIDSGKVYDLRFALVVANLSTENGSALTPGGDYSAIKSTAAICKIDYGIQKVPLTKVLRDDGVSIGPVQNRDQGTYLPNLSGLKLGEIIYAMLLNGAALYHDGFRDIDTVFRLMTPTLNGSVKSPEAFFDVETMKSSFIKAFGQLACALIESQFLVPDNLVSEGQGLYDENRLHVQAPSALFMIIGTVILSVISLVIYFIAPRQATPHDPAMLASNGIVLARSPSLERALLDLGRSRTSELRKKMLDVSFQTTFTNGGNFRITPVKSFKNPLESQITIAPEPDESDSQSHSPAKQGKWIPLFVRYPIFLLTITLPIISVLGLEILYQISEKNGGLVDIKGTPPYYVRYPSSIAALIVATLFNSLDFTLSSYAHFHTLRSGPTSASRGLMTNLIQMMPPLAWYRALKNRYFGALSSTTAAIIGSLLTVVVSGLWAVQPDMSVSTAVSASISNTWDVSWKNSTLEDGGAANRLKEILTNSSSGPEGVWDDLVLPEITGLQVQKNKYFDSSVNEPGPDAPRNWNYTMEIPALRPQLRCEPVTKTTLELIDGQTETEIRGVNAIYPLPGHCHGGPGGNSSYGEMFCPVIASDLVTVGSWYGCFLDLHMGPWNASNPSFDQSGERNPQQKQPDNPDGCPSIGIMFGHLTDNQTLPSANMTALFCCQEIQEINTNVTVWDKDLKANSPLKFGRANIRSPPVSDESTAKLLTNGTRSIESFHFRIENNLDRQSWSTLAGEDIIAFYSSVFTILFYGPDPMPLQNLLGLNNRQRLMDAVNSIYNKYMVLVINSPIFRKPVDPSSGPPRQIAGSVTTTVSRLKVNFTSKLVLQILLGVMTVLGGLGFWLTDVRGTLPRDPCSIASSMALFAGSEFCSRARLTPRAEWMSARELTELLGDQRFGLGWWKAHGQEADANQSERFGIDFGTPIHSGFAIRRRRKVG